MAQVRHLSKRVGLTVDQRDRLVTDPNDPSYLGKPANFGRNRLIYALPLAGGPWLMKVPTVVRDQRTRHPAEPESPGWTLVGKEWVWIPRMLSARWTEDTRRVG
jgi:hypothetical protein